MGVAVGVSVTVGVRLGVDVPVAVPVEMGGIEVFVEDGGGSVTGKQATRVRVKIINKISCLIYKSAN